MLRDHVTRRCLHTTALGCFWRVVGPSCAVLRLAWPRMASSPEDYEFTTSDFFLLAHPLGLVVSLSTKTYLEAAKLSDFLLSSVTLLRGVAWRWRRARFRTSRSIDFTHCFELVAFRGWPCLGSGISSLIHSFGPCTTSDFGIPPIILLQQMFQSEFI